MKPQDNSLRKRFSVSAVCHLLKLKNCFSVVRTLPETGTWYLNRSV